MALAIAERTGLSGYVPVPNEVVLEDRTGQAPVGVEVLSLEGAVPLRLEASTGDPGLPLSLLGSILGGGDPLGSVTSYRTLVVWEKPAWLSFATALKEVQFFPVLYVGSLTKASPGALRLGGHSRTDVTDEVLTPAEELRETSGLPPVHLARLFGVSRTTYYKWMEGATPRDSRFEHLVEVLSHVKDAKRRLPSNIDVTSWLRTPISPGGQSPLEYLQQRRVSTFRGLLLRARSAGMQLSTPHPSSLPSAAPMSREEVKAARERVSPSPRIEEVESDEGEESE